MTTCSHCGEPLTEGAAFCGICGAAATLVRPVDPTLEAASTATLPPPPHAGDDETVAAPAPPPPPPYAGAPAAVPTPAVPVPLVPETAAAVQATGPSWWQRRKYAVLARAFLTLALIGTGVVLGWWLESDRAERSAGTAAATSAADQDGTVDDGAATMPDLRGLGRTDAEQVLVDSGVAAAAIQVSEVEAAGPTGLVVAQVPVFGSAVDGPVQLGISVEARVPDFRNTTAESVIAELDGFGAEVEIVSRYVPDATPGEVVGIEPRPGSPLPGSVTVTLAAEPGQVDLANLDTLEGSCGYEESEASMAGRNFGILLWCEADRYRSTDIWLVKKRAARLVGFVGVPDSSDQPAPPMEVAIVVDGVEVDAFTVDYGDAPVAVDVDVAGALRVGLRYRSTNQNYGTVAASLQVIGDERRIRGLAR